jgi:hypothetical protein
VYTKNILAAGLCGQMCRNYSHKNNSSVLRYTRLLRVLTSGKGTVATEISSCGILNLLRVEEKSNLRRGVKSVGVLSLLTCDLL